MTMTVVEYLNIHGPHRAIPKYCEKCGVPLILAEYQTGFDTDTGEPRTKLHIRCPGRGKHFPNGHTERKWPAEES